MRELELDLARVLGVDPRGPLRQIVKAHRTTQTGSWLIRLSCGHLRTPNPVFTYRVGEELRCLDCGDALRAAVRAEGTCA